MGKVTLDNYLVLIWYALSMDFVCNVFCQWEDFRIEGHVSESAFSNSPAFYCLISDPLSINIPTVIKKTPTNT